MNRLRWLGSMTSLLTLLGVFPVACSNSDSDSESDTVEEETDTDEETDAQQETDTDEETDAQQDTDTEATDDGETDGGETDGSQTDGSQTEVDYDPGVTADDFVDEIDHSFFPAGPPGTKWNYEAQTEDGLEQVIVEVLPDKREVWGVMATVIRDTVYVDGELVEDTWDWFAQDAAGNVWYLGEETYEYEDDEVVCDCGSWESGVDGALPGIIMPAELEPGDPYYQEFYAGEAEDQGQIVSVDETVDVLGETYEGCIKTHDTSTLDPEIDSYKYYCEGIGFVMEEEDGETVELISFDDQAYDPGVGPEDLSTTLTNPLFPGVPGTKWVYEAETEDGLERTEVEVLEETHEVWGVEATVIRDTVYLEGEIIEDTWDWFAEDTEGNVWYLGEDTYEYEDGEIVCDCGAWASGVDGALPGIIAPAEPEVGFAYYQEYLIGEAEDRGEVLELGVSITVAAGTYEDCIVTHDTSAINPTVDETKTLCPGVGVVLEEEADERVELVEFSVPE